MKELAKRIAIDSIFYMSIYAAVMMDEPYSSYGENYASFYGILILVVGLMLASTYKSVAKNTVNKGEYKPSSRALKCYGVITSLFVVVVVSSLGWYWVASGLVISMFSVIAYRNEAERLINEIK